MARYDPQERQPLLVDDVSIPDVMMTKDTDFDDLNYNRDVENPRKVSMKGKKLCVVICILMTELCERLTYYSVVANLVLFCTSKLNLPSTDASTVTLVFSGIV